MFAIMESAFAFLMRWLVSSGGIKLILFVAITWIMGSLFSFLTQLVPSFDAFQMLLDGMPTSLIWVLEKLRFNVFLALVLGAIVTRFLIRRIPLIG